MVRCAGDTWPWPGQARVGTGSRAHSHDGLLAHLHVKSPLFSPTCSGEKFRLLASAHMLLCGLGPPHTAASQPPARASLYFGSTARPSPASLRLLSTAGDQLGGCLPAACRGSVFTPPCPPCGRLSLQASLGAWPLLLSQPGPPPSSAVPELRLWAQQPASPS